MKQEEVILGVDTHLDVHVGAVISVTGKLLATKAVPTDTAGYLLAADLGQFIWAAATRWYRRNGHLWRGIDPSAA